MTHLGLAAKAVGAIMAAALIGGCTATPTSSPTPTGPSQSPSPTVTPTPTLSPEDQKVQDAKARVVLLWPAVGLFAIAIVGIVAAIIQAYVVGKAGEIR